MAPATKTRRLAASRITSTAWWKAYLELAGGRCAYCHAEQEPLTIEHVLPLSLGGENTPENLLPVCSECNYLKGNQTLRQLVVEWEFPLVEEHIPHPLGQIVEGEWVWSCDARRVQEWRNRAHAASIGARTPSDVSRRSDALGEIAYAAAYEGH